MLGGAFTEIDLTDKQCADLIMGTDELITDFLALDPDNIVFKQPGSENYICADRNDIKTQMNDPANLVLPCIGTLLALHITPNVVCGLKMSKLQALGIAYGGYVALENMANVVANSTEQVYQIEDYDSPITVKALAGLRLLPEYAPEQVRVPFYPEEGENNDSYVRRLNEWGAQNNEPNIGDRWEDASQLLLGSTHCQSGYEGQHMYRIVSASNPEYTVNPRLLQRMKDTGCIMADSLPPVTDETPQIDWQSDYIYQDSADYTPARRLFDVSMEEEEENDVTELLRDMLVKQLSDRGGLGDGLAEMVSDDYNNRGQQSTLSFSGSLSNRQEIIRTFNQSNQNDIYESGTNTYISVIAEPVNENSRRLTYVTNLDGTFNDVLIGYPNIIVMVLDDEEKREKVRSELEFLADDAEMRIEEIEDFVSENNNKLEVDVRPVLIVVATVRPEELTQQTMNSRVITVVASDLYQALKLNQSEWETWYYDNVVKRVVNNNQTSSSDNISLYSLDFSNISSDSGNNIVLENSVYSPTAGRIVAGDNYEVDIGYLQKIVFQTSDADINGIMEPDEQNGVNEAILGDSIESEPQQDPTGSLRRILTEQLADREGMGVALAEAISDGLDRGEQLTLSFSGDVTDRSAILQTLNQHNSFFANDEHHSDSYVVVFAAPQQYNSEEYSLTYMTNLDGALTSVVDGNRHIIVMNIDDDTKRQKTKSVLETMIADANEKAQEIDAFVQRNNYDMVLSVESLLVVVATVRPEDPQDRNLSTLLITANAADLNAALSLSQPEWEQWYYKNVVERVLNNNQTDSPNGKILYTFSINEEANGINIETSVWNPMGGSIFTGDNFVADIGFLQRIQFPSPDEDAIDLDMSQDREMLSPIAAPSTSPIPMNDLTLNTPGSAAEPSTPDLSGGKKRQTRSKRVKKDKKAGKGKGKHTRRRRNNRNK